jgi:hypothetical protein
LSDEKKCGKNLACFMRAFFVILKKAYLHSSKDFQFIHFGYPACSQVGRFFYIYIQTASSMKLSSWFIAANGKICKPVMCRNRKKRGYSVLRGITEDYRLIWKYVYAK